MSVLGFSTQSYFQSHLPKISYINLPLAEMCKIAIQIILKKLKNPGTTDKQNFITVTHIEERGSCKKL
jgi:DNA-binding LacI/PurR family transcriptional regulator